MSGIKHKAEAAPSFMAGLNLTLNLHKGYKMSVAGFPVPAGVTVTSSNPKVCEVSIKNNVISLSVPETGESTITASLAGFTVPGQVNVKVW